MKKQLEETSVFPKNFKEANLITAKYGDTAVNIYRENLKKFKGAIGTQMAFNEMKIELLKNHSLGEIIEKVSVIAYSDSKEDSYKAFGELFLVSVSQKDEMVDDFKSLITLETSRLGAEVVSKEIKALFEMGYRKNISNLLRDAEWEGGLILAIQSIRK